MRFPILKFPLFVLWVLAWEIVCGVAVGQDGVYPWLDPQTSSPVFIEPETVATDGSAARKLVSLRAAPTQPMRWNWNFRLFGLDTWLATILLLLVAMILMILLIWIASRTEIGKNNQLPKLDFEHNRELIRSLPFQLDVEIGDCRQLAERAYQQGDYRKAMIYLFSHSLIHLDQHDLLRLRRGKTNRQYLREVSRFQAVAAYLNTLIVPFEAVFFGNKALSREQFETVWNGLNSFEHQVQAIPQAEVPL
ncbi:MAG: DUF4129 domain-containing protein [Pirellulaceae bacterium]